MTVLSWNTTPNDAHGTYSREFKLAALRRMEAGENVTALARDLGVKRKRLYEWRDRYRQDGEAGLRGRGRPAGPTLRTRKTPAAGDGGTLPVGADAAAAELAAVKRRVAELERKIVQQELDLDLFRQVLGHAGTVPHGSGGTGFAPPSDP